MIFLKLIIQVTAPNKCLTLPGWTDYVGHVKTTVSGRTCMRYDLQSPHSHGYAFAKDHEIYCRNPFRKGKGPWCFTTDPNETWECCNILCMVSIQMITWIKVCYMYIYCLALIICVNVFLDVQDKLRIMLFNLLFPMFCIHFKAVLIMFSTDEWVFFFIWLSR